MVVNYQLRLVLPVLEVHINGIIQTCILLFRISFWRKFTPVLEVIGMALKTSTEHSSLSGAHLSALPCTSQAS